MGAWSTAILGGDEPEEIAYAFDKKFDSQIPTTEQSDQFVAENDWADKSILPYVTAWKIMERGAPISEKLAGLALTALDDEIEEVGSLNSYGWTKPEERVAVLTELFLELSAYPLNGAKVELPPQRGLMETILAGESEC